MAAMVIPGMVFTSVAWAQAPPPEVLAWADTVLYNGQVLTVDDSFTIGEAVAIRDAKFLAVGDNERIQAMAAPPAPRIKGSSQVKVVVKAWLR